MISFRTARLAATLAALTLLAAPQGAAAQGLDPQALGGDGPLEVNAQQGIEWRQDDQVFIARGGVTASRGGVTLAAQEMKASYEEQGGGAAAAVNETAPGGSSMQVTRLEAEGEVTVTSKDGKAAGDRLIYDRGQSVLVLDGRPARLDSPSGTVTAPRLEFWQAEGKAVARGGAEATTPEQTLTAEILAAFFKDEGGTQKLERMEAFNGATVTQNDGRSVASRIMRADFAPDGKTLHQVHAFHDVVVVNGEDRATAEAGLYDAGSGIAVLQGTVRITRGKDVLTGSRATFNMKTGVSTMSGGGGTARTATAPPTPSQPPRFNPDGSVVVPPRGNRARILVQPKPREAAEDGAK